LVIVLYFFELRLLIASLVSSHFSKRFIQYGRQSDFPYYNANKFINGNPNTGAMHIYNSLICVFRHRRII